MFLADMGPSSNTNQAPRASGEPSVESSSMPSSIGDSVTCDEQVLSRRERFRHRALILGEETLSAEVKIFAKVDLPSLRALAEAAGSVDETKRQVFEHLKVEVVAAGFSCPTPRELLEIREIFSEVASYPHPMDPEDIQSIHSGAAKALAALSNDDHFRASLVYQTFGPRRDIFQLAVRCPALFLQCLNLKAPYQDQPDNLENEEALRSTTAAIMALELRPPLFRELRRFRQVLDLSLAADAAKITDQEARQAIAGLSGADFTIADLLADDRGPTSRACKLATRAPHLFRDFVELASGILAQPNDPTAADKFVDLTASIEELGLEVPSLWSLSYYKEIVQYADSPEEDGAIWSTEEDET